MKFTSPVEVGKPVNMTCEWDYDIYIHKLVTWYRDGNEHDTGIRFWRASGEEKDDVNKASSEEFEDEAKMIPAIVFSSQHRLALVNASADDELWYGCSISVTINFKYHSERKRLDVIGKKLCYCSLKIKYYF